MPDSEKVIKGLEICYFPPSNCDNCPYKEQEECNDNLCRDALALLKEQEAEWIYGEDETGVDGWHCSECGFFEPWFYEFTNDIDFIRFYGFCPSCGRKMTSYTGK
jgi:hypothetical protein